MNLAIEYLQRSGDIQNFLRFPCSLFLENLQEERIVVSLVESDQYKICITRWFLHESGKSLPPRKKSTINRDFVFQSRHVIVPGFEPLKYQEQPIPTSRNNYNRPMDQLTYRHTVSSYLNSHRHKQFRVNWLWKQFCSVNRIRTHYNFLKDRAERDLYGIVALEEQREIKDKHPSVWDRWVYWKKNLLIENEAATELIFSSSFSSSFSSLPRILLYGAGDMP